MPRQLRLAIQLRIQQHLFLIFRRRRIRRSNGINKSSCLLRSGIAIFDSFNDSCHNKGIVWPGYTAVEPGRNTGGKCRLYCNRSATVLHGRIIRPCNTAVLYGRVWLCVSRFRQHDLPIPRHYLPLPM